MPEFWVNSHMCLFIVEDEGPPALLPCTGISSITWDVTTERTCVHCGSVMEDDRCPNCGSGELPVNKHNLGKAVVTLEGTLPAAASIFHLPKGATLEMCCKCRGDRRDYIAEEVIMRFLHCHQVEKWMPNVMALGPDDEDQLRLLVDVECEVELYPEGMEVEDGNRFPNSG